MNASKSVRLREIAEKAGFSRATVSLALRNHASIPPRTRAKVQAAAQELGYRPNPLVSALMTYHRSTRPAQATDLGLAMVIDFSKSDPWRNYLSEALLRGASARAEEHGYRLEEFWLRDLKMSARRLSAILYRRSIPGVIVAPLPAAHGHMRMEWPEFSAVCIGATLLAPSLHRVTTNRFRAMRLALRQLRRKRYERIGLAMHTNQDSRVDNQWTAAYLWEQQRVPATRRLEPFIVGDRDWTERKFAAWFAANSPDVILGYNPAIIELLQKLGQRVPEDVGFAHLWNPDQTGQFAGLYHDPPAIGGAAVDFVVGMIQRNERGAPLSPQTLLLEARWQDGRTARS
jgi:LacI family transcriptional regulator